MTRDDGRQILLADLPPVKPEKVCSPECPGYSQMNLNQLVESKREDILRIAAEHGAGNIRVFGSVARGQADEQSDIDFLVELEPGRNLLNLGGLLMDLQDLLGCPVDVVTEAGLRKRIRDQVLQEAVPI
jgi:hypothetical protein